MSLNVGNCLSILEVSWRSWGFCEDAHFFVCLRNRTSHARARIQRVRARNFELYNHRSTRLRLRPAAQRQSS